MIIFERFQPGAANPPQAPSAPTDDEGSTCLEFPGRLRPDVRYRLRYRLDAYCGFARTRDGWLYLATPTGLAIFTAVRELLARAPSLTLTAALESVEDLRPLAFVAFNETTETLHFGRSLDGFASLFFGSSGDYLIVADSRTVVAGALGPIRFSKHDEEVWCARNVLDPEGSFYEGVKRCFAGTRYDAPTGAEPKLVRLMAPDAKPAPADPVQLLTDGLRAMFAEYGNRKVALRLSGGVDSRVLLVGLMDAVREGILHRDQILCTSVLFPGFDCDESAEIRQIIELSGFEWVGIEATRERVQEAWNKCLQLPAPPFPTSFMGTLCFDEAQRRGAEIMLSGHGGDELFDFNLTDVLGAPLVSRLHRRTLIRTLRQPHGLLAEAKALAYLILGRRSQRMLRRTIHRHTLPLATLHAFRIGLRLTVATGSGYEMAALAAARHDIFTDVPFFRGPFFSHIDPVLRERSGHYPYKALARRYITARAPDVATAPRRKVTFDELIARYFNAGEPNCDPVDSHPARTYATKEGYLAWQQCHALMGQEL